jgi:predicted nucleic acid-binding protein
MAKIGILQRFLDEYKRVIIPTEVYEEMIVKSKAFDSLLIKREVEKGRIEMRTASKTDKLLKEFKLHEGEAAAYMLFQELKGDVILTDDGELIKLCKIMGVPFVCAMAAVVRMYGKELLSKDEACGSLEKLFDYGRYSREVYEFYRSEVRCQ